MKLTNSRVHDLHPIGIPDNVTHKYSKGAPSESNGKFITAVSWDNKEFIGYGATESGSFNDAIYIVKTHINSK